MAIEAYLAEHPPLHLMVEAFLMSRAKKTGGRFQGAKRGEGRKPVATGMGTMEDLASALGAQLPPKKTPGR